MSLVVFPGTTTLAPGYSGDAGPDPAGFADVAEERIRIVLALIVAARTAAKELLADLCLGPGEIITVGRYLIEGKELCDPPIIDLSAEQFA